MNILVSIYFKSHTEDRLTGTEMVVWTKANERTSSFLYYLHRNCDDYASALDAVSLLFFCRPM